MKVIIKDINNNDVDVSIIFHSMYPSKDNPSRSNIKINELEFSEDEALNLSNTIRLLLNKFN